MGTISQRKLADGTIRFRAEIRISRKGFANFKESKTFSSMRLAQKWLAMREEEIEENPDILLGRSDVTNITLANAIDKYLDEVGSEYGRTKTYCLRLIQKFPIAQYIITKIKPADISEHVALRKAGYAKLDLKPIATSTLQHELLHIRGVLSHASVMWDVNVDLAGFDKATAQLRKTRQISSSGKRDRLPTTAELKKLTEYFYRKWQKPVYSYPMHLIMWFAIFSCRRESEITEMLLADYDEDNEVWKVRDLKNPNGSKGNHKEFNVLEPCRKMIELLQVKSTRKRMLNRGYDKDLLIPLSPKTIGGEFRNACKILGIEDLRFHDLRHEGCTRLAEQGFTIPQIQQVSLHDSWGSLERYVSVKKRKKTIELDEVFPLIGEE
ncbi:tyrosine-type recombinase/integrase [Acinetobacter bereziniae]|jgi:integrase|uniref:site-specific integrase n=1 Tax=Acinetobacter TaxID=469 RepID=UPI0007386704|nr:MULTISPECIES: tyrosine-type recombinase/integrase [Acinetobacter]AXF43618.1 integrase [Acinetobacter johnsonii]AYA69812.1 integrase [Acinetobacter sp. WCHA55]KUG39886.1 integrase [Acinetobacter johnsonii]MBJ8422721.1 tyrosine-type recombinase/integrase [Acinetobacter bereziniae]MCU4539654.1 tyrosine-type recombinase/integrase [Acinetobacter bereziniae]